ncbi:MAG: hypothetical protein A2340_02580 [Lentisphaerae bacterium RIFOXYB12_FULL_60_10]|nr:MAG: hypothetical protein A2340_02580 [Lentisphaerae bacterium RIFOXYB12_FULL_60_10]
MERTGTSSIVFRGRLLTVETVAVTLDNGRTAMREVVRHPGAVAALARRGDGTFVLVRQYRLPVNADLLEIVAGTLDPGETPDQCIRREVREETGYDICRMEKLGTLCLAPGYSDEQIHVYLVDLAPVGGELSLDDDESLAVEYWTADALERAIGKGQIRDAKTLAAWALFKERKI